MDPKMDFPANRGEKRIGRVRRGVVITGGIFIVLWGASSVVAWFHQADMRAMTHSGPLSGIGGNVFTIVMGLVTIWFFSHLYSSRAKRLIREGELVRGKIIGEPTVMGMEVFPPSHAIIWYVCRGVWTAIMRAFSGIMPTLIMHCELETEGNTRRVYVFLFRDELRQLLGPELPTSGTVAAPGKINMDEVLLLVFPGEVWRFPSPWAVCMAPDAPDRDQLSGPSCRPNRREPEAAPVA